MKNNDFKSIIIILIIIFIGGALLAAGLVVGFRYAEKAKYSIVLNPEDYEIISASSKNSVVVGTTVKSKPEITYEISYIIENQTYYSSVCIHSVERAKKIENSEYPEQELGQIGVDPDDLENVTLLGKE